MQGAGAAGDDLVIFFCKCYHLAYPMLQGSVDDLKKAFHKAKPQFYPSRQRFTFPLKAGEKKATALAAGKKLSDYDVKDGTVLIFKDLGPQVRG